MQFAPYYRFFCHLCHKNDHLGNAHRDIIINVIYLKNYKVEKYVVKRRLLHEKNHKTDGQMELH